MAEELIRQGDQSESCVSIEAGGEASLRGVFDLAALARAAIEAMREPLGSEEFEQLEKAWKSSVDGLKKRDEALRKMRILTERRSPPSWSRSRKSERRGRIRRTRI